MRGLEISEKLFVIDNTVGFLLFRFCCICLKWNCQMLKQLFSLIQQHLQSKGYETWRKRKWWGKMTENQNAECKKTAGSTSGKVLVFHKRWSLRGWSVERKFTYCINQCEDPVIHSFKNLIIMLSTFYFWDLGSPIIH